MDGSNERLTPDEEKHFLGLDISQQFRKFYAEETLRKRIPDIIRNFMLRHSPMFVQEDDARTVEVGIARYKTSSERDSNSIVIDEPIIIASLLKYIEHKAESIFEALRGDICALPSAAIRGYALEHVGMYMLAELLDGTKSLDEIFTFTTNSINIKKGKAQLIAIDGIDDNGSFRYSIVHKAWLYPFGMGFEASNPSDHERWFKGIGVPFCFPDIRSGHDLGFYVLVDGQWIVFVAVQFKSYKVNLTEAVTKRAIKSVTPDECYKDKNNKIYTPGKPTRETILEVLGRSKTPCLGVLSTFPSNPNYNAINEKAPEHFALFDPAKVGGRWGDILMDIRADRFPAIDYAKLPEWSVEDA